VLIVDSQVHIWAADTPERPWPKAGAGGRNTHVQRAEPWTAEEVLGHMDAAGVHRAIIVPPSWEGERNDLALDAVRRYPNRFAIMGRIGMEDSANRALIAKWREQPGMLGVRLVFSDTSPWLAEGEGTGERHWLWGEAEKHGVPITLFPMGYWALLAKILERHPRLRLCIDHLGAVGPDPKEATFAYIPELLGLARFPNLAVKASALPNCSTDDYPFPSLHEPLRQVYDAFGPQRVFWGSDLTRLRCPYRELVTMFTEGLPWLKGSELEWVMGRGVCEWFGWKTS